MKILYWVMGILAVAGLLYWLGKKYFWDTKKTTGDDVLSMQDNDNGNAKGMIELIQFLNLPNVRNFKLDPSTDPHLVNVSEDLKDPIYSNDAGTAELDIILSDSSSDSEKKTAKENLRFNSTVQERVKSALGITTVNGTSAIKIYEYASTPTGTANEVPTLANIIEYWNNNKDMFKSYA